MNTEFTLISFTLREIVNGIIFPLGLCLILYSCLFLLRAYRSFGRGWSDLPGVAVACVLTWLFVGDTAQAGIFWITLHLRNMGYRHLFTSWPIASAFIVAGSVTILAMLRGIHIFTREEMGHWGVTSAVFVTAAFFIASRMFF